MSDILDQNKNSESITHSHKLVAEWARVLMIYDCKKTNALLLSLRNVAALSLTHCQLHYYFVVKARPQWSGGGGEQLQIANSTMNGNTIYV